MKDITPLPYQGARAQARSEEDNLRQQILELADTIRGMDQLIWQLSQCTSEAAMKPLLRQLIAETNLRKQAESDRIGEIMRRELISVYAPRLTK